MTFACTYSRGIADRRGLSGVIDTLRNIYGLVDIHVHHIPPRHVPDVTASTSTCIAAAGIALPRPLPRLDPRGVRSIDESRVLKQHIFDVIRRGGELADATDWEGTRTVAGYVTTVDVGAVPFYADAVVAASDGPGVEAHVPRVPGVAAVRVDGVVAVVARAVHVDVRHGHVGAVADEGVPELGLSPRHAVDEDVGAVVDGDGDGSAGLVALAHVFVIPGLAC